MNKDQEIVQIKGIDNKFYHVYMYDSDHNIRDFAHKHPTFKKFLFIISITTIYIISIYCTCKIITLLLWYMELSYYKSK